VRKRSFNPWYFVVHHSATNSIGVGINTLKAERLRRGEGYNIIIDHDELTGQVKFAQDVPDDEISNGTYGINDKALNICINANFEDRKPTEAELKVLEQVLVAKMKKYGCRKKDVNRIITHQHAGLHLSSVRYGTACPGKNMILKMADLRTRVAKYLPE
jgi:hypothetical protein